MKRWRFETNRISSVALRSLKVRNPFLTLTWPGDLTFGDLGLKFIHKVSNSIVSRYWKNGGAALRRFSAIREKPEGWAFFAPPPPVRVLKRMCLHRSVIHGGYKYGVFVWARSRDRRAHARLWLGHLRKFCGQRDFGPNVKGTCQPWNIRFSAFEPRSRISSFQFWC